MQHAVLVHLVCVCTYQWVAGTFPPGWKDGNVGTFRCGHHHLLAHAHAVKLYRDKYQADHGGKLSIAVGGVAGRE